MPLKQEINDFVNELTNSLDEKYMKLSEDEMYAYLTKWQKFEEIEKILTPLLEFNKIPIDPNLNELKTKGFEEENNELIARTQELRDKIQNNFN